jgi:YesN/AraC family two-component response regulator
MKAKAIIESGEFSSINEVAYTVGYDDPLYFSRHFKKYFGIAPSKV